MLLPPILVDGYRDLVKPIAVSQQSEQFDGVGSLKHAVTQVARVADTQLSVLFRFQRTARINSRRFCLSLRRLAINMAAVYA